MNLLEHYIKEIHLEAESKGLMLVDLTVDCYGKIERTTHVTTKEAWEQEKKQGYFMG